MGRRPWDSSKPPNLLSSTHKCENGYEICMFWAITTACVRICGSQTSCFSSFSGQSLFLGTVVVRVYQTPFSAAGRFKC